MGVAVSKSLIGPWVKRDGPLILGRGGWGAGQPSVVAVNGSLVLVVFTRGDRNGTRLMSVMVDLSDVQRAVIGREAAVTASGWLLQDGFSSDPVANNAAIVHDPVTGRLWAVREGHPLPRSVPGFISTSVQVCVRVCVCVCKGLDH